MHEAADSSPTHQHAGGPGQGKAGDNAAHPGPLPSEGRGGSEAACRTLQVVSVGALPTSDMGAHTHGG